MRAVSSKSEMLQRTHWPKRKSNGSSSLTAKAKLAKSNFMKIWITRLLLLAKVAKIEAKTASMTENEVEMKGKVPTNYLRKILEVLK